MLGAQFPSSAAICHPCPCAALRHPPTPSPSRHSVEDALRSNGRCLAPPFFLLLICHLALLPSDSLFSQTSLTPHCASLRTRSSDRHSQPPPPPFTKDRRRLIYNQGGNAPSPLPHHLLPPFFRHGVNTNEEEMSLLPCPHLSQWPRDVHPHAYLSVHLSLSHTRSAITEICFRTDHNNVGTLVLLF